MIKGTSNNLVILPLPFVQVRFNHMYKGPLKHSPSINYEFYLINIFNETFVYFILCTFLLIESHMGLRVWQLQTRNS